MKAVKNVNGGAIVDNKRRRRVRKALTAGVDTNADGEVNSYLRTLLDPERYSGVRYPDKYDKKTAMVTTIINAPLPFIPAVSVLEPPGTFLTLVNPALVHPALIFIEESTGFYAFNLTLSEQTDDTGLFPLDSSPSIFPSVAPTMLLPVSVSGVRTNLRGKVSYNDQDFALPQFQTASPDGSDLYTFPMRISNLAVCNVVFGAPLVATENFRIFWATPNGNDVLAGSVVGTGANSYQFTLTGLTSAYYRLPGIGFRCELITGVNSTSRPIVSLNILDQLAGTTTARFAAGEWPDVDTYLETVDRYRTVSMSVWLEYQGSDLQNGGQLAGLSYGGGTSPFDNGLFDYDGVSQTPGSYSGPVKFGNYSIWVPVNDFDMLFRRLDSSSRWQLPYIVLAGNTSTPTQLESLRLRIVANHEIVSTSQFYNYDFSPVQLLMIEHAARALRSFPLSMENPDHVQMIKDALRKAVEIGSKVGDWVMDNKVWLAPAAEAAMALLL